MSDQVNATLKNLLVQLQPTKLRKAMREIAMYLKKSSQRRISQQKNAAGEAYQARKDSKNKGKMLQGFKKHIRAKSTDRKATVGIFGHAAKLGAIHHEGQTEDGIGYAERELVGISDADVQGVEAILRKYLE